MECPCAIPQIIDTRVGCIGCGGETPQWYLEDLDGTGQYEPGVPAWLGWATALTLSVLFIIILICVA